MAGPTSWLTGDWRDGPVAPRRGGAYGRAPPERSGARVGLAPDETARPLHAPADAGWTDRLGAVLRAVDELVRTRDVADDTWAGLATHLTAAQLVALVQLVTQYDGLATSIHTLRIQPDQQR